MYTRVIKRETQPPRLFLARGRRVCRRVNICLLLRVSQGLTSSSKQHRFHSNTRSLSTVSITNPIYASSYFVLSPAFLTNRELAMAYKQEKDFHHPYAPYPIQVEFMNAVYTTIEDGCIGIFESPTGRNFRPSPGGRISIH